MARVEIPVTVLNNEGQPVNGASVNVTLRSSGAGATLYAAETGSTTTANPATTDASGRISAWVERGAYNLTISGTGITTYTEPFDAAPGGNNTIDNLWLPDGVVQDRNVASGISASKLTTGTLPSARIGASSIARSQIVPGAGSTLAADVPVPANNSSTYFASAHNEVRVDTTTTAWHDLTGGPSTSIVVPAGEKWMCLVSAHVHFRTISTPTYGFAAGIAMTGATTYTLTAGVFSGLVLSHRADAQPEESADSRSWIYILNAGTTTLTMRYLRDSGDGYFRDRFFTVSPMLNVA